MIQQTGPIDIPISKTKLSYLLIGALLFVLAGIRFLIDPPQISNPVFGNPSFIRIVSAAAVLFFGLATAVMVRRIISPKPGLTIDAAGITHHASALYTGTVRWSDIQRMTTLELYKQKLLLLELQNPEDYINQQSSPIKKKLMEMNWKQYGTPLSISANTLRITHEALVKLVEEYGGKEGV